MADTDIILNEKLRDPRDETKWFNPLYITEDGNIHMHGYLETDGAVTNGKIADDAIVTSNIQDGQITNAKMAENAITSNNIANNAVTYGKLAQDSVDSTAIIAGAIKEGKIDSGAVTSSKIKNGNVNRNHISTDLRTLYKIDNSIQIYQRNNGMNMVGVKNYRLCLNNTSNYREQSL